MMKTFAYLVIFVGLALAAVFFLENISPSHFNIENKAAAGEIVPQLSDDSLTRTVFVGDIMLDRGVAAQASKEGVNSLLGDVSHIFSEADAIIGNFEGTMTSQKSIAKPNVGPLRFTADPKFKDMLKEIGFTALGLANNHSLDFSRDGYLETKNNLHDAGILTFGSALNNDQLSTSIPLSGMTLCLVGYHDLFVQNEAVVIKEIQNIRNACTKVVVFVHWGVEYQHEPTKRQRSLAYQFIDAGADLVIGAHPHIVEPIEIYQGKAIFYSLGNFMFDQEFSFDTTHGLAVNVEWGKERTRFELIPVSIHYGQVRVADDADRDQVLRALSDDKTDGRVAGDINNSGEFIIPN